MATTDGTDKSLDRLAESVIDGVLSDAVSRAERVVDEALAAFADARARLAVAQHDLRIWRTRRELGHETGIQALQTAQLADFVPSAVPPGTHQRAVTEYLKRHPPVWQAPRSSPVFAVVRRGARSATRAIRSVRPTLQGRRRR